MSFLALTGVINFITCFSLGLFVLLKNVKSIKNISYFILSLSISLYSLSYFLWQLSKDEYTALFWFRILTLGIILINISYLLFVFAYVEALYRKKTVLVVISLLNFFFIVLNFSDLLYTKLVPRYNLGFWPEPTAYFHAYLTLWFLQCFYGFYWLLKGFGLHQGNKKIQIKYFIIAAVIGFAGGATNWPMWYNIYFPPYLNILVSLYTGIVAYAILRHHLMDISVAIKRTAAYSISAGLLTAFFAILVITLTNLLSSFAHVSSMKISIVAAFVITILFNPLRNKIQVLIDRMFYKKSFDYYETVRQVSSNLASMFDLEKIYQFICNVIYDAMGLKNVYLLVGLPGGAFDIVYHTSPKKDTNIIDRSGPEKPEEMKMNKFTGILKFFRASDNILVKDELTGYEESLGQEAIDRIKKELEIFQGAAVVPVFIDKKLSLLIILGQKHSGDMFTSEDMDLLKTISNQTAIALKNVRLYQEKVNSEKLASLGMMSGTFAHEIRNPLTSLKTFAQLMPEKYNDPEFRDTFSRIVISDIQKIDSLISDLLDFSTERKSTRMNNFNLIELVDGVVDYVEGKLEFERSKITIEKNCNEQEINMMGDTEKFKQALGNIVLNGCQAMHGEGILRIGIKPHGKNVDITVEDTGEGINPEDLPKIFDPFVTTKKMGIGLGLAISKRIVEDYNGKIYVKSQPAQGTTFTISLPVQNQ
jgi:signal transduction histidine kinase